MNLSRLKNLRWQDLLLIGIILMYLFLQNGIISQYKALPSPVYGGDYYFQLGSINHIRYGGNPLGSSSVLDSEPGFFILYSSLVAVFANLLSLESIEAMFYFSQLLILTSFIVVYYFLYYLFKDKTLALLGVVIYLPITRFPVLKYTEFTIVLMMPLFFFSMFYLFKIGSLKSGVIAGIVYGLCAISHGAAFFVINVFFMVLFLYMAFFQYIIPNKDLKGDRIRIKLNLDKSNLKRNLSHTLKLFLIVFVIGFSISLLYWFKPIFIYHGKTSGILTASYPLTSPEYQSNFLMNFLRGNFLNFRNFITSFTSIFFSVGVVSLFLYFLSEKLKFWDKLIANYICLVFLTAIFASFHFLLTEPLLGINFHPTRPMMFTMPIAKTILVLFGISSLIHLIKIEKYKEYLILVLLVSVLIQQPSILSDSIENNVWTKSGRSPLPEHFEEMSKWVIENTDVNDVFLSTNELSFAFNALTGRKGVVTRRVSHHSPFLDIDQREADLAIILYGEDDSKRRELLKKYDVDYLYWNYYWIQSEYTIDQNGRIVSWYDPLITKDTPYFREYLDSYNIRYYPLNTYPDPSKRGEEYAKSDLLLIVPQYRSLEQPWSEALDKYMSLVWEYKEGDSTIARIYRIKVE
ncbi:MAG: hypothetical protein DRO89_02690 [Candidatus Altiarchaeales archaeon]|nr:MAG: hypothetical protein DRO89_02690 [Candidatus Altiarchaeales archaeon]